MNSNSGHSLPARVDNPNSNLIQYPTGIYPEELLDNNGGLDLKEFINVLIRRKKAVVMIAAITTLLALLITLLMQPVYRASSTVKVERYAANANVDILKAETSRSDRDYFETQIQLLQTKTLARRVIDSLGLDTKQTPVGILSKLKSLVIPNSNQESTNKDSMEEIFLKNLTVKPISNSQLLTISYDSSDPKLASEISNTIAKTFLRQNLERRFDTASSYKTYVSESIEVTRKALEDAEKKLNAYARKNGILQDVDGKSSNNHTLKKQSEELVLAEKERIEAQAAYQLYKDDPSNDPASIINNPYILSLKKAAARLESKYQGYKNKRTRSARNLKKEFEALRGQIKNETDSIKLSLKTKFLEAQQKEKMLRAQLNTLKGEALNLQAKNTKYSRLRREVEINQVAYNQQLEQLMAVNLAANVGTNNISIIDKASPPTKKFKPSFKTNLAFGGLLGLLLGMGFAFLREFTDDSLKDSDALEKVTGLPVLSLLPEIKNINAKKLALQTALEPRSPLAEAIRSLRTSLRFSTRNGAPKSIFITSSGPTEGKSTVALNLATAYAQTGKKVLLIDTDLRNPSIHHLLELQNVEGLTNYLANPQATNDDISTSCMINQLNVITSGPVPPDPVELLSGRKMNDLLESARKEFDHIIIDGPPILGLADSLILADLADATLVTIEAGKTKKTNLLDALKRLERANATILGTVLSRMSRKVNPAYDQKYYSYTSSYSQSEKITKIR